MPAMRRKGDLPIKVCAACGRTFTWRKRWAKVWDEVRYCSDACRDHRGALRPVNGSQGEATKRP